MSDADDTLETLSLASLLAELSVALRLIEVSRLRDDPQREAHYRAEAARVQAAIERQSPRRPRP